MGSNAVPSNYVSAVVGYEQLKGYFNIDSPNLPQNISIFGEANTANQSGLSTQPVLITSRAQAAALFGYGNPIDSCLRILFPSSGANVSVPVWVFPQVAAGGSVAKIITVTPTGTATANGTVKVYIGGRTNLDGASYNINIVSGDTPTLVCDKIRAAVAATLGCPVTGSGTATFIGTAKWTGLTSNDITISVDTTGTSTGVTFAVVNTTAGSGTPAIATSLTYIGNSWNTLLINTYGLVAATMTELEAFNGIPDPTLPTGRYNTIIWKPLLALSGTLLDDPTTITSAGARPNNVTIVPCVAPLSAGLSYEAAANVAYVLSNIFQNTPHGDVLDQKYPDMPPPLAGSIPAMNSYTVRNSYVQLGCSTVDFVNGTYVIKDLITTYNPTGEIPPFYRWVRDINIYWNYKFGYFIKQQQFLVGKTLVKNSATVTATNVMKPNMWVGIVANYNLDCERRALIVNAAVNNKSIAASINSTNPNRMDTTESIQISGLARICSTDVTVGFNFSN
jgi:phage tail sheath gpL-like